MGSPLEVGNRQQRRAADRCCQVPPILLCGAPSFANWAERHVAVCYPIARPTIIRSDGCWHAVQVEAERECPCGPISVLGPVPLLHGSRDGGVVADH